MKEECRRWQQVKSDVRGLGKNSWEHVPRHVPRDSESRGKVKVICCFEHRIHGSDGTER